MTGIPTTVSSLCMPAWNCRCVARRQRCAAAPATGCLSGRSQPRWEADDGCRCRDYKEPRRRSDWRWPGYVHGIRHLRLDPALPLYLLRELSQADQEHLRARWAEGIEQLVVFCINNGSRIPHCRATDPAGTAQPAGSTRLAPGDSAPEQVVGVAACVEGLLAFLGRPHALAQATAVRAQAAQALTGWSHARFNAEIATSKAAGVWRSASRPYRGPTPPERWAAGDAAYQGTAYDIASATGILREHCGYWSRRSSAATTDRGTATFSDVS